MNRFSLAGRVAMVTGYNNVSVRRSAGLRQRCDIRHCQVLWQQ